MNTGKLIHVLLIALLCYGQLVTNMHAVGHFDYAAGDVHKQSSFGSEDKHAHGFQSVAANIAHTHAPSLTDSDAEPDCTIYHIYLNQFSVTCAPSLLALADLRQARSPLVTFTGPFSFAVQNLPIRAPPIAS